MRVVIAGATGFIGRALCRALSGDFELVALSRDVRKAADVLGDCAKGVEWDARTTSGWSHQVEGARAVVNLTGESLAYGRWTQSKKDSIVQSRTNSAGAILDAITGARNKPAVFIQASAIGYYGSRGAETLDEDLPAGRGFLAELCRRVESIAAKAQARGVRQVSLRTGLVLGREGGVLPRFMWPYRFYLGGYIGHAKQWLSWVSLHDGVRAIRFLMEHEDAAGPFNVTAPQPATMKEFSRVLGRALGRPAWTVVPAFAVRLACGEMADEVLLASHRVVPKRLIEAGFRFARPDLTTALNAIIRGEDEDHESR